jgi:nicotinate-nucleotide adenylyltransferase
MNPKSSRRIGILGGSFDPVHKGHLALALTALTQYDLDEVRLMPCAQQALKGKHQTSAENRCALLRLAIANYPQLTLDCREVFRSGKTYTYDTLLTLHREDPNAQYWFICGMDSVCQFDKWYRAKDLIDMCSFLVFDRPGIDLPEHPFHPKLLAHRLTGPLMDVSSSDIRQRFANQHPVEEMIGPMEARYIKANKLYTTKEDHS